MVVRLFGLAAACTALGSAFMIPSTISLPDVRGDGLEALNDFIIQQTQASHLVRLECAGCSFRDPKNEYTSTNDVGSDLVMRFEVSARGNAITLNGVDLFPYLDGDISTLGNGFQPTAPQADSSLATKDLDESFEWFPPPARKIHYEASIQRSPVTDDDPDYSLVHFDLQIKGLDDESVHLDKLTLRLLKDDAGRHRIIDILKIPNSPSKDKSPSYAQEDEAAPSYTCAESGPLAVICRAKAAIAAKMGFGDCHGAGEADHAHAQESLHRFWILNLRPLMQPPEPAPGSLRDVYRTYVDRHYRRHSGLRRFAHALHAFVAGFLLPVFIGIAAGITASLLGVIVGTMVGWLWFRVVRGGKRGEVSRRQRERELVVEQADEEESRLLEEEAPPVYVEKE